MKKALSMVLVGLMVIFAASCSEDPVEKLVKNFQTSLPQQVSQGVDWTNLSYDKKAKAITFVYEIGDTQFQNLGDAVSQAKLKPALANIVNNIPIFMNSDISTYIFTYNCGGDSFSVTIPASEIPSLSLQAQMIQEQSDLQDSIAALQSMVPYDVPVNFNDSISITDSVSVTMPDPAKSVAAGDSI